MSLYSSKLVSFRYSGIVTKIYTNHLQSQQSQIFPASPCDIVSIPTKHPCTLHQHNVLLSHRTLDLKLKTAFHRQSNDKLQRTFQGLGTVLPTLPLEGHDDLSRSTPLTYNYQANCNKIMILYFFQFSSMALIPCPLLRCGS